MQLPQIFLALGEDNFQALLRSVSMGRLRTYQLFDRLKARAHLHKLNQENLRKAAPRLWARLQEGDAELASDLSQCILVCALDMIIEVLNFLGVPHNEGFIDKDTDVKSHLTEGWRQRAYEHFRSSYPEPVLLFYLNHLAHEFDRDAEIFLPVEAR